MHAMQSELNSFESVSRSRHLLLKAAALYAVMFIAWLFILDAPAFLLAWPVSDWLVVTGALALVTEAVIYRLR